MNPEANGEISNEFFKKLNQQIVQKDNLIKLLQLQIRNLKTQIEAGGAGSEESAELKKALDEKAAESERLLSELEAQKGQYQELEQQKDEQIKALSQMLEEHQASSSNVADVGDDPRIPELEQIISSLREEIEAERQMRAQLEEAKKEADAMRVELATASGEKQQLVELKMALDAAQAEAEQANAALATLKSHLESREAEAANASAAGEEVEFYKGRVLELEQDVANLKSIIAEKDEAGVGSVDESSAQALALGQAEIERLQARVAELEANPALPASVVDELERLRQENSGIGSLNDRISRLQAEAGNFAETAMKLTALESERELLVNELDRLKNATTDSAEVDAYKLEIARLREVDQSRENELARLRVSIEARQDESINDPVVREEVEQLTRQVADQLLAIQNFEGMISKTREQLQQKDAEIDQLKARLGAGNAAASAAVIPVTGESEIITSFIDFFDGLDSMLIKNPLPELQALHQKLLDRLIIPNKINYMQVISEEFDPEKHCATDYFRSTKFPERCIVFEVEKGYRKGDAVIKKSKVWVVQNLFSCQACGAVQSNPDSRFCHLCGSKIVAPNGLPVDSLPEFEPSPTTYQRFAERMLERNLQGPAKEYILAGLAIDPNFVPLMTRLADILAAESQFEEAMNLLKKANSLKADPKTQEKIQALETKLNIFKQAKSLKLSAEEFEKLLHLIQK